MSADSELLRRYVDDGSQEAFAELVRLRIDFVYATAVGRVGGDVHLAKDVTQEVFAALAAAAPRLRAHPVLAGWLHTTTRFAAARLVRAARRRQQRERDTGFMPHANSSDPSETADWQRLHPWLDAALDELDARDREAVLLRFFEERSFADIGALLKLSENAARMRVERAMDKLHAKLSRHGVTSTAAALGLILGQQAALAAPTGLAGAISTAVLAGAAPLAAAGPWIFLMSKVPLTLGVTGIVAAAGIGVALHQNREAAAWRAEVAVVRSERDAARSQAREAQRRLDAMEAKARAAERDVGDLLAGIDETRPGVAAAVKSRVTAAGVRQRFEAARLLAQQGRPAEALAEFLWCYDEGMKHSPQFLAVRLSVLLSELGQLAKQHAPAAEALRARRDEAARVAREDGTDYDAAQELLALNTALGEQGRNVELLDQLPRHDPRRKSLGLRMVEPLLAARRYADALDVFPYDQMTRQFSVASADRPPLEGAGVDQKGLDARRDYVVTQAARHIEILAGAGETRQAGEFLARLLAYDASPKTRHLVRTHLQRAGRPELMPAEN